MSSRAFVFLGAASYALYMIHLPIDIVWFHALERVGVTDGADLLVRVGAVVGVFVACIAASMVAYLLIEEPARNFIRKLEWPKRGPAPQLSGAQ
jgi:peptidoglycan/LPS O-acetylase OafA/YrhL